MGSTYHLSPIFLSRELQPPPVALSATACPFEFRRPFRIPASRYKYYLPASSSSALTTVAICKDRWTKRGVNWAFFKILKQGKATLTYAILVRLNSPTG